MIKKSTSLLILLLILFGIKANSQEPVSNMTQKPPLSVGFGFGIDYGGFGLRMSYTPIKYAGVFAAAGYNIVGLGYNFGLVLKALPNQRVCPYLIGMYGYNAVIKITGLNGYDKIYYGPSTGIGLEIWNRKRFNYFNLEFVYPFRPEEYDNDLKAIKNNPQIKLNSTPPDFSFSIGYHIGIRGL